MCLMYEVHTCQHRLNYYLMKEHEHERPNDVQSYDMHIRSICTRNKPTFSSPLTFSNTPVFGPHNTRHYCNKHAVKQQGGGGGGPQDITSTGVPMQRPRDKRRPALVGQGQDRRRKTTGRRGEENKTKEKTRTHAMLQLSQAGRGRKGALLCDNDRQ